MLKHDVQKKIWNRIEKRIEEGDFIACEESVVVGSLVLTPEGVGHLTNGKVTHVYQPEFITQMVEEVLA